MYIAWPGHPKDCQKVNRPPDYQFLADRIDRGRWKFDGKDDLKGKQNTVMRIHICR